MQSAAQRSAQAPTILIVEDDHDSRVLMRSLLEDEGYVVDTAANGRDAVEKAVVWSAAAAVDRRPQYASHGRLGASWDICASIPSLSMIPIGVQSADEDATLPDGVAFVINKPVDVHALLAVVRHHCG